MKIALFPRSGEFTVIFEKPLGARRHGSFHEFPRGCKITEFQSLERFAAAAKQLKFQVARGQLPSRSATANGISSSISISIFPPKILPPIDIVTFRISNALTRARRKRRSRVCRRRSSIWRSIWKTGYLGQLCKSEIAMQTKSPLPDASTAILYAHKSFSHPLLSPHPSCLI